MEELEIRRDDTEELPSGRYVFISYSHDDKQKVEDIIDVFSKNHFRYWYDNGIKSGSEWDDVIWSHIRDCGQFIVFMSKNALKSKYVKNEIHIAADCEKQILVVYLEDVKIVGGINLHLTGIQSININSFNSEIQFYEKLLSSLNKRAYREIQPTQNKARQELEQRYTIEKQIGAGGVSRVFLAYGKHTGTRVAIKHGITDGSHTAQMMQQSFEVDRKILAMKICPFSPELIDYYEDEENIYLVESYIDGQPLSCIGGFSVTTAVNICLKIAHIVGYFHKEGLVHNDIKPANIIMNSFGDVFILDFTSMTKTGKKENSLYTGTAGFTAPELFTSAVKDIDCRSDIYCLGRTLHYLLTRGYVGGSIYNNKTTITLSEADYENTVTIFDNEENNIDFSTPHLDEAGIHDELLDAIVQKMTSINPDDRFPDMKAVEEVLSSYLDINKIAIRTKEMCKLT